MVSIHSEYQKIAKKMVQLVVLTVKKKRHIDIISCPIQCRSAKKWKEILKIDVEVRRFALEKKGWLAHPLVDFWCLATRILRWDLSQSLLVSSTSMVPCASRRQNGFRSARREGQVTGPQLFVTHWEYRGHKNAFRLDQHYHYSCF